MTTQKIILANKLIDLKQTTDAQNVYRAFNHPLRLKILKFLEKNNSSNVSSIYKHFKQTQAFVSLNLKILRDAKLVETKKEARNVIYSINEQKLADIISASFTLTEQSAK